MQLTGHITPDNLMSLEAYHKYRKTHKDAVLAHRKLRSVHLGEHLHLQFESETTIRYQIQEMLRIEKVFEEEGILQEIEAYAPLVPDGTNWKATMTKPCKPNNLTFEPRCSICFLLFMTRQTSEKSRRDWKPTEKKRWPTRWN